MYISNIFECTVAALAYIQENKNLKKRLSLNLKRCQSVTLSKLDLYYACLLFQKIII